MADFELPPDGLSLLTAVCRTVDELDKLHTAMACAEVMTTGSQGQPVVNPLFAEARAHRVTLAKLLAQLALPDEDDTPPLTATQERARNAAQARWAAHRQRWGKARAWRRRPPDQPAPLDDLDVPLELLDPGAAVWHDQCAYHRFMAAHGWTMPPAERMGCTTAPANRRQAAAAGWALQTGIATRTYGSPNSPPHQDWHRLRALGLL